MTIFPATYQIENPDGDTSHLENDFHTFSSGKEEREFILAPILDFKSSEGLRFAISVDDKEPQIVNMHKDTEDNRGTTVSNYSTRECLSYFR